MKTKTLLIAAAALAAGVISSQAQVYSQNIVGYANVSTPVGGSYYMVSVPFLVGVSNGANEVYGNSLPDFTTILTWNAVNQSFSTALYDSTEPVAGVRWYLADDSTPGPIPVLPVGKGFFINPGSGNFTNTFTGSVAINSGSTNNTSLPSSGSYYMLGSYVPYAGSVTNGNPTGQAAAGINLNNLPDFTTLLTWDSSKQGFVTALYDSTEPVAGVRWYLADDSTPGPIPSLKVGEGFYLNLGGSYTWRQLLQ